MRQYYFTNTDMGDGTLKSELILLRTNLDDNGTFQCVAENRAGIAVANFTLNVVVPVPPKPPQAEMIILHQMSLNLLWVWGMGCMVTVWVFSAVSNTNYGATYYLWVQDVVEERFQKEYLIAIGVAAVIVSVLTTVIVILVAVKCRGIKKSRRRSYEDAKIHLYQNSAR